MSITSGVLLCPLLQDMRKSNNHSLNNNKQVNMGVVCIHGLVSCLGILENALILWVVGFRLRHRTVASVWVLNLALSDFLATLTLPLFTSYLYHSHSWELGHTLCKTEASIFFVNMFVSAFLLAAISLDRLLLVARPVWCRNHRSVAGAWKVCGLGWLWAALNSLPYTLFRSVTPREDNGTMCYHNFALIASSRATLERDCEVRQAATAISKLLLAFVFPLVVIAGSYIQIGLNLRSRSNRRTRSTIRQTDLPLMTNKDLASGSTHTKTKSAPISSQTSPAQLSQSFMRMVTFVIAAFVLCWAPYHILCVIELTAQYRTSNLAMVEAGLPLATTIAFLNPVLNPILYVFSCPHLCVRIRQSLGAVFDGLVEEDRGRTARAHMRRKDSRDVSPVTPGLSKRPLSPCQSPAIGPALPLPLASENLEDHLTKSTTTNQD